MSTLATPAKKGRLRQIAQAYQITKQSDRRIGWVLLSWFVGVGAVIGLLGWLLHPVFGIVMGLLSGLFATLLVFGRRAERAAYAQVEGQMGAAAGALQMLRRGWSVKPAIAFTKNQDIVHRVVGLPGIVLVGEGSPNRVRHLLTAEKKKHARVAPEVPTYDLLVGDGDGCVPLPRLVKHIRKLPRNIRPAEMTELVQRLKALDAMRPQAPLPRGPMPTSGKDARRMMQGR
ncbi:MAG: DUF4191 domain-containing protein [Nocardioidaceae bacterium]|nr:DUF4191 domain-containing protein [Nocardioidaceae bacterium]MDQ3166565.1 DUF4191 domain-containing protein [Actinomycetota bacterium]